MPFSIFSLQSAAGSRFSIKENTDCLLFPHGAGWTDERLIGKCKRMCSGFPCKTGEIINNFFWQIVQKKGIILVGLFFYNQLPFFIQRQYIRQIISKAKFNIFYQSKSFYQPMIVSKLRSKLQHFIFMFCIHGFCHQ